VIEEPEFQPDKRRIDLVGIALLATGMPALQYVLEEGNREVWFDSVKICILAGIAAISLITFIVHVLEDPYPIVDLRVFKNRSYAAGTGINFLTGLALFASSYLFSLFCGSVMHYTALDIGRVFLIAGLVQIVLMPVVGRFAPKIDPRLMLFVGVSVVGGSQWLGAQLTSQAGFHDLVMPQLVRAIGLAFIFIPVSVASLSDLSAQERGNATGLFNLTRELGGSLGTAWMGKVVADGVAQHGAAIGAHLTPYSVITQERVAQLQAAHLPSDAILAQTVGNQALVMSFEDGFRLAMFAILVGLALVLMLRKPKGGPAPLDAH
jgi:MFS transporter, DHA2 family, multidrug resistance protein